MYVAFSVKYSYDTPLLLPWRTPVSDDRGSVGVFEMPGASVVVTAAPVIRVPESYLLVRHEPVAARVVGGGTPSVVPTGAVGFTLPEGAVLVSAAEATTSTLV